MLKSEFFYSNFLILSIKTLLKHSITFANITS